MIFGRRFPPPLVQRRPQAARHQIPVPAPPAGGKTPNPRRPGGIVPPCPGVGKGAGPGGLWPPERRPGPAQREPRAGPRQGAAPTPPPGRWGGPAGGGRVRGGARTQARPPTPRPGGHSQRPGHRHHGRAPRRGGCGPPHPGGQQRDRTQADHGPGAPPPATSQHQRRRGRPGRGRTRPGRCDGAGAAGPGQYRPGLHPTGRIHLLAQPATFGGGRATATGAAPAAGRSSARDSGRAEGPRGGRIRSRGHPSRSWGGVAAKKNAGRLAPPRLDTTGRKKNAGRTLCPPPLAVIADTRFPPVRRNSPKRTLCRPVPYALVMRPPPGLRSCVP